RRLCLLVLVHQPSLCGLELEHPCRLFPSLNPRSSFDYWQFPGNAAIKRVRNSLISVIYFRISISSTWTKKMRSDVDHSDVLMGRTLLARFTKPQPSFRCVHDITCT